MNKTAYAHRRLARVVGDLPGHSFHITPDTITRVIFDEFRKQTDLPGVLVMDKERFRGIISRQKCFELLGRPFGVEVFLKRPVSAMMRQLRMDFGITPSHMPIGDAVIQALRRPAEYRYEPLAVEGAHGRLRVVDMYVLLRAQSELLLSANALINQQIEIGQALASTLDTRKVLDMILERMSNLIPYDRAAILFLENNCWRIVASLGYEPRYDPAAICLPVERSDTLQKVFTHKTPVCIPDVSTVMDWRALEGTPDTRSWLGVPLIYSGKVLGILSATRLTPYAYSDQDLEVAQAFADQAAVALQNARMYEQIAEFNKVLESQVEERTNDLQDAYRSLENLDRAKTDFINTSMREFLAPLKVLTSDLQMLATSARSSNDKRMLDILASARLGVERLQAIIDHLLEVNRMDAQEYALVFSPVNLNMLLLNLANELAHTVRERRQSLIVTDLAELPVVVADAEALKRAFTNLLYNAIKFTPNGGRIEVKGKRLAAEENPLGVPAVQITIRDTGIGIEKSALELIFSKFYRRDGLPTESSRRGGGKAEGPGLGLAVVRSLVEANHGKVWAESAGRDEVNLPGSSFIVLLPVEYSNGNGAGTMAPRKVETGRLHSLPVH